MKDKKNKKVKAVVLNNKPVGPASPQKILRKHSKRQDLLEELYRTVEDLLDSPYTVEDLSKRFKPIRKLVKAIQRT